MLAMMVLFVGTLFSAMIAGLSYWRDGRLRLQAQEALRESLDTMTTELRQAIPDPDPGINGNPPTGYIAVDPDIDPTGFLYPNVHNAVGNYLEFTEPVETVYQPAGTSWAEEIPNNYQKIRYFIEGGVLKRRVTRFNADGTEADVTENSVVTLPGGELSMTVTFISPTFARIEMTATLNKFTYTINTLVKTGS